MVYYYHASYPTKISLSDDPEGMGVKCVYY